MSNAKQKLKRLSSQQWASIIDRYYNGEDPYMLANESKSDPSIVFDHINKDRRARAKKGLPPRVRKNSGSDMPEFIYIDGTIVGQNERKKYEKNKYSR